MVRLSVIIDQSFISQVRWTPGPVEYKDESDTDAELGELPCFSHCFSSHEMQYVT